MSRDNQPDEWITQPSTTRMIEGQHNTIRSIQRDIKLRPQDVND